MEPEPTTSAIGPGWHHATGDPAGTSRYWDGSSWQGEPTTIAIEHGWHHAPGDPAGTSRYWNGSSWQGEPTTTPGTGEIYYVNPPEAATPVAAQVTVQRGQTAIDQGASVDNRAGRRRAPHRAGFSENLRGRAIDLGRITLFPMAVFAVITYRLRARKAHPDRFTRMFDLGGRFDADDVMLVLVLIGFALIACQIAGAVMSHKRLVAVASAGLALGWTALMIGAWADFGPGDPMRLSALVIGTVIALAQAVVAFQAVSAARAKPDPDVSRSVVSPFQPPDAQPQALSGDPGGDGEVLAVVDDGEFGTSNG